MLRISDAASLGLHAMALLAAEADRGQASVGRLAERLGVSAHHLAKVMQRLSKSGLVRSRRGPRGGFALGRAPSGIRLIEVFEAIEGPFPERCCMLEAPACQGDHCLLGGLLESVKQQFHRHLCQTRLSDLETGFKPGSAAE